MDDFTWHARGQLCEQHATARNGQRHIYRIGVFERKEYAARAAECVTACIGISSVELRAHGVVSLIKMAKVAREAREIAEAARRQVAALQLAESFISGFEGDESQKGIAEMLAQIRAAIPAPQGEQHG